MAKRGILPLLMLGAGVAVLTSSKKAKAEPKPTTPAPPDVGPEFPGGVTDQPQPLPLPPVFVVPNVLEVDAPHTIRKDDIPNKLAQYYTGDGSRFKELGALNPQLGKLVTKTFTPPPMPGTGSVAPVSVTNYEGWQIGKQILLPGSWKPYSKPLPKPASSTKPTDPPVFPPAP